MARRLTKEEFLEKVRLVHGDRYNYDKFIYLNNKKKGIITCQLHGDFLQQAGSHLLGKNCPKCNRNYITTEEFIKKARLVHGNRYDYSLVIYVNNTTKVKIICPNHEIFEQAPFNHLQGQGCSNCGGTNKLTTEEFIRRATLKYNGLYNYPNSNYIDSNTKLEIECIVHGTFLKTPDSHLHGQGCPNCNKVEISKRFISNKIEFLEKAKLVHKENYNYDISIYTIASEKMDIICNQCKNVFKQTPNAHLSGCGCPNCNNLIREPKLFNKLKETFSNKNVIRQGKPEWLKIAKTNFQSLDIYFPDYNIAIEYQGTQHFKPVKYFGGIKKFNEIRERDERKYNLCLKNNCKLLYFTYIPKDVPSDWYHKVYTNENELINEIKKYIN